MDTMTGKIKRVEDMTSDDIQHFKERFVGISEDQMTEKQKREMQVSKHDNRSELGKIFTQHRKLTRAQKNRRKRKK